MKNALAKNNLSATNISLVICIIGLVLNLLVLPQAFAVNSKKVPAMRDRVYSQLARAQKVAEEESVAAGLAILDELAQRVEQMNSYEQAMLWNFYGFTYYQADDVTKAIAAFEKVIAQSPIPDSLTLSTLYSLAQLALAQEQYPSALARLKQWRALKASPLNANEQVLFAQLYYQLKQFSDGLDAINQAIAMTESQNAKVKENWLVLQRAFYYELGQPEKVTQVLERLVSEFDRGQYWLQLAGMYGEIGQENKQLATMETAYQAGHITAESDLTTLAQLYLYHGIPYKAARLMSQGIESGQIVRSQKNLEFLAQAWMTAKESDKAIPLLKEAALMADDGNNFALLAETLVAQAQWQPAIEAANQALEKGQLNRPGNMHIVLGMAFFNLELFADSLQAFEQAIKFDAVAGMAKQWTKYVQQTQQQHQQLASAN